MKQIIIWILIFWVLITGIMYSAIAFANWETDPGLWPSGARAAFAFFWAVLMPAALYGVPEAVNYHNNKR